MKPSLTRIFIIVGVVVILLIVLGANVIRRNKQTSPTTTVVQEQTDPKKDWRSYEFKDVGLSFSAPPEMSVTGEMPDPQTFTLYVQRSTFPADDYYQLYGLYNLSSRDTNIEDLTADLEADSVKKSDISGFAAVSGQYKGERNRFVTYIVTDKGLFTLATSQPTETNEQLTAEILSTFDLQ